VAHITSCLFDDNSQLTYGDCDCGGGLQYVGEFQNGLLHGRGGLTYTSGGRIRVLKGSFHGGLAHGLGVQYDGGKLVHGGLYHTGKLECGDIPFAERGYSAGVVCALKKLCHPDSGDGFWGQSEEDPDASDDVSGLSSGEGSKRQRAQTVFYTPEVAASVGGRSGSARKRKKRKKGGYSNKATREQRSQRVEGTTRSCLPDAVWAVAPGTLKEHGLTHDALLACMPAAGDTTFAAAGDVLRPFGYTLASASEHFMDVKGGAELALLQETVGRYVVQLRITFNNDDPEPDWHCVAFDGQHVYDNTKEARSFIALDDGDRATPAAARAVFNSLYPGLKVVVTSVYELVATDPDWSTILSCFPARA